MLMGFLKGIAYHAGGKFKGEELGSCVRLDEVAEADAELLKLDLYEDSVLLSQTSNSVTSISCVFYRK